MKIQINDIGNTYDVLMMAYLLREPHIDSPLQKAIQSSLSDDYEKEESENEILDKMRKIDGVGYGHIEMPYPFDFTGFIAKRAIYKYSATIIVSPRDPRVFSNSSEKIEGELENGLPKSEVKLRFIPTTRDGTGYIMDNKEIIYVVSDHSEVRGIHMGRHGAISSLFRGNGSEEDRERFELGIRRLETISNFLINTWYDSFPEENIPQKSRIPKDLTLHLNCI